MTVYDLISSTISLYLPTIIISRYNSNLRSHSDSPGRAIRSFLDRGSHHSLLRRPAADDEGVGGGQGARIGSRHASRLTRVKGDPDSVDPGLQVSSQLRPRLLFHTLFI